MAESFPLGDPVKCQCEPNWDRYMPSKRRKGSHKGTCSLRLTPARVTNSRRKKQLNGAP